MNKLRIWLKNEKRFSYHDLNVLEDVGGLMFILEENLPREQYQFSTGLYDKSEREIYQGDIVINAVPDSLDRVQTIIWNNERGCFEAVDGDRSLTSGMSFHEYWTVLGNVYENQELTK